MTGMQRTVALIALSALLAGTAFTEEAPAVTGGSGATLRDLVGADTYVSVVLNEREAVDPNLRVVEVGCDYFAVMAPSQERMTYLFSSVKEIRVQDGLVEAKKVTLSESRTLRKEQRTVVAAAQRRIRDIFKSSDAKQFLKMHVAALLGVNNDKGALDYLRKLAASNDLETKVAAALCLFLAGETEIDPAILAEGLHSGNATVKANAIRLVGLLEDKSSEGILLRLLRDRSAEISAPAARALARLGSREAIPRLMQLVSEGNPDKGEAAVFALSQLGGEDVIQRVKAKLEGTGMSLVRHRLVIILYNLGDDLGRELLIEEIMKVPTLRPEAALVLAREGQWDGMDYLATRLKGLYDEKDEVMIFRAKAAVALIQGGDPTALSHLQELLRSDNDKVKRKICTLLVEFGDRKLIPIVAPVIENADVKVAAEGCTAAIAMANRNFRERMVAYYN